MTEASSFRVPPWAITGGRTRSEVDLSIESLVTATDQRKDMKLAHEKAQIVELCKEPQSIAEISAHLKIPLQVAKILAGDLIGSGHLSGGKTASASGNGKQSPDVQLLNKVLDGLQSL